MAERKIVEIDENLCNGCGQCVTACDEGALKIVNGKAKLVGEVLCDGLGACIGDCPTGALTIVTREAAAFDEETVKKHLDSTGSPDCASIDGPKHVCPGSMAYSLKTKGSDSAKTGPVSYESSLSHWPVKLRLLPPAAPFLTGSKLLVLADCAGVAYAALHGTLLKDTCVAIACPKFEDASENIGKLTAIFSQCNVSGVTVAIMEVPCCRGLAGMVRQALEASGAQISCDVVVIGRNGDIQDRIQII